MGSKPKILLVDDQKSNLALLRMQLKEYEIKEAQTSGEALKHFSTWIPDLVIMDILMPGMDGFSLLTVLRKSEKEDRTPIVALTALDAVEDKVRCLDLGADVFVPKPFAVAELRAIIRSLLRSHAYTDELIKLQGITIGLSATLEDGDPYYSGHSLRVAQYAHLLARATTPIKADQDQVRLAAMMHDIGKLSVSCSVYHKQGELTAEEWVIVKKHPQRGCKVLEAYLGYATLTPYVLHHHEHWDGSGYPDGLKGHEIPIGSRIIAIADAYDAMLNARPHRKAYSPDEAIAELEKGKGAIWDPSLCDLFVGLAQEGKLSNVTG